MKHLFFMATFLCLSFANAAAYRVKVVEAGIDLRASPYGPMNHYFRTSPPLQDQCFGDLVVLKMDTSGAYKAAYATALVSKITGSSTYIDYAKDTATGWCYLRNITLVQ